MFSSVVVTVGQQKVWFCLAKIAYCKKHLWPKNTVLGDKSCGDSKMCSFGHCQRAEMTWTWYIYAWFSGVDGDHLAQICQEVWEEGPFKDILLI